MEPHGWVECNPLYNAILCLMCCTLCLSEGKVRRKMMSSNNLLYCTQ